MPTLTTNPEFSVMPGLDPGIHGFISACAKGVDRRVKPGDDVMGDSGTNRWRRNSSGS
jgi:hypothetical protein